MAENTKDVPAWAKYAFTVIIAVVGTVWAIGEIKGNLVTSDAVASTILSSHENRISKNEAKDAEQDKRISSVESGQNLVATSQERIEDKFDSQGEKFDGKLDKLSDNFHALDKNITSLNEYLRSIESIDNGSSEEEKTDSN